MKALFFTLFTFVFMLVSCSEDNIETEETPVKEEPESLVTEVDGLYTEWYPGRKQIKIKGRKNKDGKRTGIWKMYAEQGYELSIAVYKDGEMNGHIVVYHPNGAIHYSGEYDMGERVGEWKFYNENGEYRKTINYDQEQ